MSGASARRTLSTVAVCSVALLAVAALSAVAVWTFMSPIPMNERLGGLWALAWIGLPAVGAILASRRPDQPLGWVMVAVGAGIALTLVGDGYLREAAEQEAASGPVVAGMVVVYNAASVVGFGGIPVVIALFPSGRIVGGTRRLAAGLYAIALTLLLVAYLLRGNVEVGNGILITTPMRVRPLAGAADAAIPVLAHLLALLAFTAIIDAVVRFRRSKRVERAQMKWFVAAVAAFPFLFTLAFALESVDVELANVVFSVAMFIGLNGVAAAIGAAVLRYRLYDIDRIISRTVSYATLTLLLASVYLVVVTAATMLTPGARTAPAAVAASTLAAAALFAPARRRIQHAVDGRFDRSRYDAVHVIEDYRSHVRAVVDLDAVSDGLVDAAQRSVHPATAGVWLRTRRH